MIRLAKPKNAKKLIQISKDTEYTINPPFYVLAHLSSAARCPFLIAHHTLYFPERIGHKIGLMAVLGYAQG